MDLDQLDSAIQSRDLWFKATGTTPTGWDRLLEKWETAKGDVEVTGSIVLERNVVDEFTEALNHPHYQPSR